MTEYNVGDRVRLTRGTTVVEGDVVNSGLDAQVAGVKLTWWTDGCGYKLELVSPAPKLELASPAPKPVPTEGWWYDGFVGATNIYHFESDEEGAFVSIYSLSDQFSLSAVTFTGKKDWREVK